MSRKIDEAAKDKHLEEMMRAHGVSFTPRPAVESTMIVTFYATLSFILWPPRVFVWLAFWGTFFPVHVFYLIIRNNGLGKDVKLYSKSPERLRRLASTLLCCDVVVLSNVVPMPSQARSVAYAVSFLIIILVVIRELIFKKRARKVQNRCLVAEQYTSSSTEQIPMGLGDEVAIRNEMKSIETYQEAGMTRERLLIRTVMALFGLFMSVGFLEVVFPVGLVLFLSAALGIGYLEWRSFRWYLRQQRAGRPLKSWNEI